MNSNQPSDLPPLFPCTLTITQDGAPLDEATVRLMPMTEMKYRPASVTDADGKVSMSTYGFPGVPAGRYKVVVSKEVRDDLVYADTPNPSTGLKEVISFKRYRIVEPMYSSEDSSPHEIEITGKGKKMVQTLDVGKAVKTEFKSTAR